MPKHFEIKEKSEKVLASEQLGKKEINWKGPHHQS
jgi:hypothetical protein